MKTILVTGGAGFIGSHFVDLLVDESDYSIIVLDKLTYAGKLENMSSFMKSKRVNFVKGDICDSDLVNSIFDKFDINFVVNFAAESHVDNSIVSPDAFITTNILGTHNLLKVAQKHWKRGNVWIKNSKFIQISTDEVYGSIAKGSFTEISILNPSSPYSSSKASADLICLSYYKTFGFPILITRSSNNYGPRQDKEKLIPKIISNIKNGLHVPIYGNGSNIRDWLYVADNCRAILAVLKFGIIGEIYNIGSGDERSNLEVVKTINKIIRPNTNLLKFVPDRLGHDFRYSLNTVKLSKLIPDQFSSQFEDRILTTIDYYE